MEALIFEGEYSAISEIIQNSLIYYVTNGQPVGGFLNAVLSNNLNEAAILGDLENRRTLSVLARWIHFKTPGACHGSQQAVNDWIKHKGLRGVV